MNEKSQIQSNKAPCGISEQAMNTLVQKIEKLIAAHNQTVEKLGELHRMIGDMSDGGAGK